jgi:hypothetical protein
MARISALFGLFLGAFLAGGLAACATADDEDNRVEADARVQGRVDAQVQVDARTGLVDAGDRPDAEGNNPTAVVINEVLLDQVGNDADEFAELYGAPNTDYSDHTLVQLDGDNGAGLNPGVILTVHAGCTTNGSGFCLLPVSANSFQNGSQSLLLVKGAGAGIVGTDVDTTNDGVIDAPAWSEVVDAVSIYDQKPASDNTDLHYAGNAVLLKTGNGDPTAFGGASRIPDGMDTDAASDWVSNAPNFDNSGIVSGQARNTPGATNSVEP